MRRRRLFTSVTSVLELFVVLNDFVARIS